MDYRDSSDFRVLQKLSDLEKYIESDSIGARTKQKAMEPIKAIPDIVARRRIPIPIDLLNKTIESGTREFVGHINARQILLKPQEAMYHAIGRPDEALYKLLEGITITDIISMIRNKAAVRQYVCPPPMPIDESDVPRHISKIMVMRSVSPSFLSKQAREHSISSSQTKSYHIDIKDGSSLKVNGKFIKENKTIIQAEIDDGVILKIMEIYSNGNFGKDVKSLVKEASVSSMEALYLSLLL